MKTLPIRISAAQAAELRRHAVRLCVVTEQGGEVILTGLIGVTKEQAAKGVAAAMGWREPGLSPHLRAPAREGKSNNPDR